jgi:hypothetical protein
MRQSPRVAGPGDLRKLGGSQFTPIGSRAQFLDGKPVRVLLHHHANYVDAILLAICANEPISLAGRQALAFTVDRLHEIAEVLA